MSRRRPETPIETRAKLLRRVRKDSLKTAARWEVEHANDLSWLGAIEDSYACAENCLEQLRQMKQATA